MLTLVTENIFMSAGLCLYEQEGPKTMLKFFPRDALSVDHAERFKQLFEAQPKWELDELSVYLADLIVMGVTQAKLLLKYARSSTVEEGGTTKRLYSAR